MIWITNTTKCFLISPFKISQVFESGSYLGYPVGPLGYMMGFQTKILRCKSLTFVKAISYVRSWLSWKSRELSLWGFCQILGGRVFRGCEHLWGRVHFLRVLVAFLLTSFAKNGRRVHFNPLSPPLSASKNQTSTLSKVNRRIAKNGILTKCRKSYYVIKPNFFSKNVS